MNVATALRQGQELLEQDSIAAPRLTAEVLLAHALRCERVYLYAHPERELADVEQLHFGRYLHERLGGKPTQYITGRQEFYGRTFRVTPAVLIPRPETEHVVEAALRHAAGARRLLDIGTGSGCLAVTLKKELPAAQVAACDISAPALEVARENARTHGAGVAFFQADAAESVARIDLIVSNPPYVPAEEASGLPREVREHEPAVALFGGPGGVEFYPRLLAGAARALLPGGRLIVEIGYKSRAQVEALVGPQWAERGIEPDLAGIDRVMVLRKR